jgi:hypothetical protein
VFQELCYQESEQPSRSSPQGQPERKEAERPSKGPSEHKQGVAQGRLKAQGFRPGEASEVKAKENRTCPGSQLTFSPQGQLPLISAAKAKLGTWVCLFPTLGHCVRSTRGVLGLCWGLKNSQHTSPPQMPSVFLPEPCQAPFPEVCGCSRLHSTPTSQCRHPHTMAQPLPHPLAYLSHIYSCHQDLLLSCLPARGSPWLTSIPGSRISNFIHQGQSGLPLCAVKSFVYFSFGGSPALGRQLLLSGRADSAHAFCRHIAMVLFAHCNKRLALPIPPRKYPILFQSECELTGTHVTQIHMHRYMCTFELTKRKVS